MHPTSPRSVPGAEGVAPEPALVREVPLALGARVFVKYGAESGWPGESLQTLS